MMINKKNLLTSLLVYCFVIQGTTSMYATDKEKVLESEMLALRLTATEHRLAAIEKNLEYITATSEKRTCKKDEAGRDICTHDRSLEIKPSSRGRCHDAIYPLPAWPFCATFYDNQDLVKVDFSVQTASKSYNDNGGSSDLSHIMFGSSSVKLKEIVLASKLVDQNKLLLPGFNGTEVGTLVDRGLIVATTYGGAEPCPPRNIDDTYYRFTKAGYYLGILADQKFEFDAHQTDYSLALNYSRNLHDGDVTLGFYLPLIARSHHIKLTSKIAADDLATINEIQTVNNRDETNFTNIYPTLDSFLDEILHEKGMTFNKSGTTVGLSDVTLYANTHFRNRHVSRLSTGISLLLPTGREADCTKLWQKPLGNGGFFELSFFGSALLGKGFMWNPYVHAQATYVFSSRMYRRVPRVVRYDGQDPIPGTSPANESGYQLPMSDALAFLENVSFSLPDSTVRGFSDQVHKVSFHKGPKLFIRLGNIFADVFSCKSFIDVYYDLNLQGHDHIKHCSSLDSSYVTKATTSLAHSIALNYSYQFHEGLRLRAGGSYVFAGRNTPQTFGAECSVNVDF